MFYRELIEKTKNKGPNKVRVTGFGERFRRVAKIITIVNVLMMSIVNVG